MRYSLLASLGIAGMVLATFATLPVAGQNQTKKSTKAWVQPKTPDGKPDLQGVWNNATLTPMQRAKEYAEKPVLTEAEARDYEQKALKDVDADRRDGGGAADVGRAYNEFWRDRGKLSPDRRTSLVVDPPDGRIPALTPQATKRNQERNAKNKGHEFDGPENRALAERCIAVSNAGPPMIPANYNANYQIVQSPGMVALLSEQIHDVRLIHTDGRGHIPSDVRQLLGDSIGHWEGNTLVVETTNFTDRTAYQGSGENMKLIEKFTRTGPNSMDYEFTVNDPESFTKPWTAKIPMNLTKDEVFEYACHEGNYGLEGSLSGARAQEREAELKGTSGAPAGGGQGKQKKGK